MSTSIKKIIKLLLEKESAQKAFSSYHLVRRKFILSHACDHFKLNKMEPAPLLNYSLLDIGCGDTEMAAEMTFRGADVTAVNVLSDHNKTLESQKSAQKSGAIVSFEEGGAEKLIEEDKKFDIILCMDLFEYVDHTSKFIDQIDTLLKEDGILLFSTNNRNIASFIWHIIFAQKVFKWVPKNTYRFKRFRPPERLTEKLLNKKFSMVDICGVYLDPDHKRWKRREEVSARYLGAAIRTSVLEKQEN